MLLDNRIQTTTYSSSDFIKPQQNQMQGIPWINNSSVWVHDATYSALTSVVKPWHGWAGYLMEPSSSSCHHQHPGVLLEAMHILHLANKLSNSLLLSQHPARSPFHQENSHCPTHLNWESGLGPVFGQSQSCQGCLQRSGSGPESEGDKYTPLPPFSFNGCTSITSLCKSRTNLLTLLRLFHSNSGLNTARISSAYACFQSKAINLQEQAITI